MAINEWNIQPRASACEACARAFADKDPYHTFLFEERGEEEVRQIGSVVIAPAGVGVANYAFDVTPATYVTAIVTERGIARPPYRESLSQLLRGGDQRESEVAANG